MFGDSRDMELHYFLADDTVEICERIPNNSGRDAVPMFLRRQRLPKVKFNCPLLRYLLYNRILLVGLIKK